MLGACRGTDENGAQVGANSKYSNSCDVDGKKKRVENTGLNDHMAEVTKTRRRLWIHGAQGVAQADELGKSYSCAGTVNENFMSPARE